MTRHSSLRMQLRGNNSVFDRTSFNIELETETPPDFVQRRAPSSFHREEEEEDEQILGSQTRHLKFGHSRVPKFTYQLYQSKEEGIICYHIL